MKKVISRSHSLQGKWRKWSVAVFRAKEESDQS